jgi:hypothetical protein
MLRNITKNIRVITLAEENTIVYCLDFPSSPGAGWPKVREYVAKLPDIAPGVKGKGSRRMSVEM